MVVSGEALAEGQYSQPRGTLPPGIYRFDNYTGGNMYDSRVVVADRDISYQLYNQYSDQSCTMIDFDHATYTTESTRVTGYLDKGVRTPGLAEDDIYHYGTRLGSAIYRLN
ncbi:MAG: hypothetical protein LBL52_01640 [Rickettsiales bacterium]|jgi:hypothetical protein|nr:hypothetical protein [Rickettsiales bacterium]